jgi:hypothetical protein
MSKAFAPRAGPDGIKHVLKSGWRALKSGREATLR